MSEKFTSNYSNPRLSPIAANGNFDNPQYDIDQLNKNVVTDPNMTVKQYMDQMRGITGESDPTIYESTEQYNIDSLNKDAATDPNMTVGDYIEQMGEITGESSPYMDEIAQQNSIDALNKNAAVDPNMTVGQYAEQMSEITGEANPYMYSSKTQYEIDKLNKSIIGNPDITIGEYAEQMSGITGEANPYVITHRGPIQTSIPDYSSPQLGPGFYHTNLDSRNAIIAEQRIKQEKALKEKMTGYSASDWEAAMKDPSQLNLNTKEEVLDKYISTHSDKIKETRAKLEESATKKKSKKNLTQSYDEATNNSTSSKLSKKERKELEKKLRKQEAKLEGLEYRKKRRSNKAAAEEEIKKLKDLKKNLPIDDNYMDSVADIEKQIDGVSQKLSTQQKVLKSQSKATIQGKLKGELSPFKVMNTAFALTQAVGSYKESRAEGHGVVNSAIKGVGDLMLTEALGPIGYGAYQLAKVAPKAAIKGTNMLYQENRRMNSASNFVPLGGVNFQDTQDLATMRQSGMELAKMSQYNLEQTLMGAEAKHLHR